MAKTKRLSKIEKVEISNPLVAVACVGTNGDDNDSKAKTMDYVNTLLTFNEEFSLNCAFEIENLNQDEKSEEAGFRHEKEPEKIGADKIKQTNYKVSWTKDELISFCNQVVRLLEDKKNKYDSLIFVLTSNVDRESIESSDDMDTIIDSNNNSFLLKDLFNRFNKENCSCDWKTFPLIFLVDRYSSTLFKEAKDWSRIDFIDIELDGEGQFYQFYVSRYPSSASESPEKGGYVTRALKSVLTRHPVMYAKKPCNNIYDFYLGCSDFIRKESKDIYGHAAAIFSVANFPCRRYIHMTFWV